MSTIDLTILGLLKKKSMSPYDMVRFIEFRGINSFIKISAPAVYKNMIKMHKKGYLSGERIRESEMPEKMVYSITEKGEKYFRSLMRHFAESPGDIIFDFNSFVAFSEQLQKDESLELLSSLKESFELKHKGITALMTKNMEIEGMPKFPGSGRAIMKQYAVLYEMLGQWVKEFKDQLSKG